MLEWLKNILGEMYTEDIDKAVSTEIGNSFVSKANYDAKNEAYKGLQEQIVERDNQLEALKKVDAEGLQNKINELQNANKTMAEQYESKITELTMNNAIESALNRAGARNLKAVKALLDMDKIKLDKDGSVIFKNWSTISDIY